MADSTRGVNDNFIERLYATEDEYRIKVGTVDGYGFFFCGTTTELKEVVADLEEELHDECRRIAEDTKKRFNAFTRRDTSPSGYAGKAYRRSGRPATYEEYENFVKGYFKELAVKYNTMKEAERRRDVRTPLSERKIVETYKSISEDDTWIVIITGEDVGKYWTEKEYKEGVANEDK